MVEDKGITTMKTGIYQELNEGYFIARFREMGRRDEFGEAVQFSIVKF